MADVNKFQGLSFDFHITDKGSFSFKSGHEKAQDNFLFFFSFAGWFRVYFQDYCSPLWELVDRPSILFNSMKVVIFGRMRKAIAKYMTYIDFQGIDFYNDPRERKTYLVSLIYKFKVRLDDEEKGKLFTAKILSNGS